MNRIVTVGCTLVAVFVVGCGRKDYTGERRFPLSGKITVDGEPMEHGLICFFPKERGQVSGGPITKGAYSIPEEKGANAGSYKVEIHWTKPTGKRVRDAYGEEIMDEYKEGLPDKYHKNSELIADISAKRTTFDFDLNAK